MRWLLYCLLVSLAALLIAAAGMAIHILLKRRELHRKSREITGLVIDPVDETDLEPKV
jgi:hypothetical protein